MERGFIKMKEFDPEQVLSVTYYTEKDHIRLKMCLLMSKLVPFLSLE